MFGMALQSAGAFFRGKLFRNNKSAYGLLALGIGVTAVVLAVTHKLGLPLYGAAGIAGFVGGALQPQLYKNLKYQ
jgi:hypothetical protein